MNKSRVIQKLCLLRNSILTMAMAVCCANAYADGSKDMYPEGGKGYRAAIWSANKYVNTANPFPTMGVMKVYAKAGEHILLGSSAIGKGNGAIDYIAPDGTKGSFKDKTQGGRIDNRQQELAGPNYNGSITNGFDPISITVTEEQEGVWEIYFVSPAYKGDAYNSNESTERYGIESWKQQDDESSVMAFDISVSNADNTALIPGRAFTNVLNLCVLKTPSEGSYAPCWYSNLYILTDVGYIYKVNTNGQNPHFGAFFSNNKGIQKAGTGEFSPTLYTDPYSNTTTGYKSYQGGEKSYQSVTLEEDDDKGFIYDPRLQDNRTEVIGSNGENIWKYEDVTHKIFFCKPANDLPEYAKAVYGGTISDTWLRSQTTTGAPKITNLGLAGKEAARVGILGPEGFNVTFEASVASGYVIEMDFGTGFTKRTISGTCVKGRNIVEWDGEDGDGTKVPLNESVSISLTGELTTAEVHFPFVDLENNENGLILELVDNDGTPISDIIYWDDTNIQSDATGTDGISALEGTASAAGAHKWKSSNSTGDGNIIDTWSYVKGIAETSVVTPAIKYIDLAVTEASVNTTSAKVGEEITYTFKVANLTKEGETFKGETVDANSDADSAAVGVWMTDGGFIATEIAISESDDDNCKVLAQPNGTENGFGYISLANGKTATITVKGHATNKLADMPLAPQGFIMRPGDIFEIDAENIDNDGMPNNPTKEYVATNNNLLDLESVNIQPNGSPVIDNTNTEMLKVAIKAEKGTDYAENGIMLPVAITDPEKGAVSTTISGPDAALFTVIDGNIYYIGTTPATDDKVVYNITTTAKDAYGATTVRDVEVTIDMTDGPAKASNLKVNTETIKYGQPVSDAIAKLITADTTAEGVANGEWIIRNTDLSELDKTAVLDAGTYTYEFSYYAPNTSDFESQMVKADVTVLPREVTISSASTERPYDGSVLKNETLTIGGDGFYAEEGVTASEFPSLKNVGEIENTFTYVLNEGTKSGNYNIAQTNGTLKVTAKELTVDGTTIKETRPYDGTTDCEIVEVGNIVEGAVVEGENVTLESVTATYTDKNVGDDKDVTIHYTLSGDDAANYVIADVTKQADITPKALTVTNTKIEDKDYDGTTTATIEIPGELNGVVEGDAVTLDNVVAVFENETPGSQNATVTYTLGGDDVANYTIADATLSAVIRAVDVNFDWTYNNPVYGDNVGTGEEVFATYKGTALDPEGTYVYYVDGVEVSNTTLIVPGDHIIKVVYTDKNDESVTSLEQTIPFGKAVLTPVTNITKSKPYDGNTNATAVVTDFTGKVNAADDVDVNITASNYDNENVGEGKTITINYDLTGENANYYTVKENDVVNDGIITKAANNNTPDVNDAVTSIPGKSDGMVGLTPEMEYSADGGETWNKVTEPGTGLPAGNYLVRFAETENLLASEPVPAVVTDPTEDVNFDWTYNNPVYGDNVGTGEEVFATYKGTALEPEGTYVYFVDGVEVTNTTLVTPGLHTVKVFYTDNNEKTVESFNEEVTFGKAVLTPVTNITKSKPYDGNTNAAAVITETNGKVNDADDVDVEITSSNYDDKNIGENKTITVTYGLTGENANYYTVNPSESVNDGIITKAANSNTPAVNDALTTGAGKADGMVGLTPEMEYSADGGETWNMVTEPGTGLPAGSYLVRFAETENLLASDAVPAVVTDPLADTNFEWTYNSPVYGDNVGTGEEVFATYNGTELDPEGTYVYYVDGIEVTNTTLITPGPHTVKTVYTDSNNETATSVEQTIPFGKAVLTPVTDITKSKPYDGNTVAAAVITAVNGKVSETDDVDVEITASNYDDETPGENKAITVNYGLTGANANYYTIVPSESVNDGIITKLPNSNTPAVNDAMTTGPGEEDGMIGLTPGMEYSADGGETWTEVTEPETGLPAGTYQVRFPETATTQASAPATAVVTDPATDLNWTIAHSSHNYGDAILGVTDMATYKNASENITYIMNNEPATIGSLIPAGENNIKAVYTDPETGKTKQKVFTCTVAQKTLTVAGGASEPKAYDGNTNATLAQYGTLSGMIEGDDVTLDIPATVATFDNENVGTDKDVTVTYALKGAQANNYAIQPVVLTDGIIYKAANNNTPAVNDAMTSAPGEDDGMIGLAPEMEISDDGGETWAKVTDPVKGLPAGTYLVRFPETNNQLASAPVTAVVTDPATDPFWTIEHSSHIYGDAVVGVTDKVAYKNDSNNMVYEMNGNLVAIGTLIPAGENTIKAVYTNPENGKVKQITLTCIIAQKALTVEGGTSEPKAYDGNTDAKLATYGTLTGVIGNDDVQLDIPATVANFKDEHVGTGKDVEVNYALKGEQAKNYTVPLVVLTDGIITKTAKEMPNVIGGLTSGEGKADGKIQGLTPEMEISRDGGNTWEKVTDPEMELPAGEYMVRYEETPEYAPSPAKPVRIYPGASIIDMVDANSFVVNANGYCPESEGIIKYNVIEGNPTEYRAIVYLKNGTLLSDVEFTAIEEDGQFTVAIPLCDAGTQNVKVQFRNANGSVSPVYNFDITVNLSEKYIYNLWNDVVSIINKNTPELESKDFEKRFTEFQWFKNDKKIDGATMPYYNEKGGLDGVYFAEVVTTDNRHLRTCSQEWHFVYGMTVDVYPNPVVDNANVFLSVDNGREHKLVVTDMMGATKYNATFNGKNTTINFTGYTPGWYIVSVDNVKVKVIKK